MIALALISLSHIFSGQELGGAGNHKEQDRSIPSHHATHFELEEQSHATETLGRNPGRNGSVYQKPSLAKT